MDFNDETRIKVEEILTHPFMKLYLDENGSYLEE